MQKQSKALLVLLSLLFAGLVSSDVVAMKRKRRDDDDKNPKKSKIRRIEADSDSESRSSDSGGRRRSNDMAITTVPIERKKTTQTVVEIIIHRDGRIDINKRQEPVITNIAAQQKAAPSQSSQQKTISRIPLKKRRLQQDHKTLTDLCVDTVTQIIFFMLSPNTRNTDEVNIPEIMTNLKLVCQLLNTTIKHMVQTNPLIKNIFEYIFTQKKLLHRTTLFLYLKLNDVVSDSSSQADRITIRLTEDQCRLAYLSPLFSLCDAEQQKLKTGSGSGSGSGYAQRRFTITKTLIKWLLHKQVKKYNDLSKDKHKHSDHLTSSFKHINEAIQFAAGRGDLESIQWLLNLLADGTIQPIYERTTHYLQDDAYGKALEQAAINGHKEIVLLFAQKLEKSLASTCIKLNIMKKTINKKMQLFLISIIKEHIDALSKIKKTDSKKVKKQQRKNLDEEIGAFFVIAAQINDLALMKYVEKKRQRKKAITEMSIAKAFDQANSGQVANHLMDKHLKPSKSIRTLTIIKLLITAAKKNFLRMVKYLAKHETVSTILLPRMAPELFIIAVKHGNFELVQYLLENVTTDHKYNLGFQEQAPKEIALLAQKTFRQTFGWLMHTPSTLKMAILIAAKQGSLAKTEKGKKEYKKIISYLLSKYKELSEAANFMIEAATKPAENKKK